MQRLISVEDATTARAYADVRSAASKAITVRIRADPLCNSNKALLSKNF